MAKNTKIIKMAELAILTAIVIILQTTGTAIKLGGTSISLVLIPIVLGAVIIGPVAGAFLGFVFGFIAFYFGGVMGLDFFTMTLYQSQPIETALICLIKGTAAGYFAGLIYKAILKLTNKSMVSAFAAAAVAPVVNTGLFILGGLLLVQKTLSANLGTFGAEGQTVLYFLIIGCAGINFIAEFILNVVLAPAIDRISIALKRVSKHK